MTTTDADRTARDCARRRYKPRRINILFVAEAPPSQRRRFFYFDRAKSHDWLYLALMRWLYNDARDLDTIELRERKAQFLRLFAADGNYLVDACEVPMLGNALEYTKRRMLTDSIPALKRKLVKLRSRGTRIVLIGSTLYRMAYTPLRRAGFNVINTESIDCPSTGRQREFGRKLGQILDADLRAAIHWLEEAVRFWGPGKENQKERELYVAEHFLRGLGVDFEVSELIQPDDDPPDVSFRGALFEVKEVQEPGRKRHDEYKRRLAKARQAERFADLIEHFSPEDISIGAVCARLMEETRELMVSKYPAGIRSRLDLLFYVNFGMNKAWSITAGALPDLQAMQSEGWRSVSFFHDSSLCCVLVANSEAPKFLHARKGELIWGSTAE